MIPTNVMSFMKKIVTTQPETSTTGSVTPDDSGTLSKLRQIGSGFMTGNVSKLTPNKVTPVEDIQPKEEPVIEPPKPKPEPGKPVSRAGACRVCIKSFKPEDFSRTCFECQHKVCEDCASYSDDQNTWRCSVCRLKSASRGQPIVTQESTDSLLDVPVLEALQRRHSDAMRIGGQPSAQSMALGSGLVPPRSPDLRRHSDVSPASLKELERFRKVAGERHEGMKFGNEFESRTKSRGGSPDRHQSDRSNDRARATSPQRSQAIDQEPPGEGNIDRSRRTGTVRRKSRITRKHSYDDEINKASGMGGAGNNGQSSHQDIGLGLPVQLSRRASAYDVFTTPGGGGLNAMAIVAAQHRASISSQGSREPEERPMSRRASFRIPKPYEMEPDEEKMINLDASPAPEVTAPPSQSAALGPDEERRTRRRGSQLPDINAIRGLPSVPSSVKVPPAVVSRVAAEDRELPRQGSLVDGEGIKIVIHDVDSDPVLRHNPKRRVKLRRDPLLDKGHRARGFGMRVVGGKTGSDGHMFACIVWTVPGGPAEKAGLQQGDKVLEWSGVPLIDRSFEEVAQIIERTDDVAELVVEHATDIVGDLLDDPGMIPPSGKGPGNLGLPMESETEKTPSSPTRRKLPKTPEQIAKERQVTGRIQIQVWYEADRKELVVSVLAADELCAREDNGYGTLPEAYAKLVLNPPCADQSSLKTDVAEPTQNPIWNATLNFTGVAGDKLMERTIEVTLWDYCPEGDNVYLGECSVDLQGAFEVDRAVWYRLEDPRGLRSAKSPFCSPRGSLSMEIAQRLLRKTELRERSYSDDGQSDSGSPEPCFLHPDHAWHGNSRRGSSQSEQLEIEPYELSKDYSISLPGSRRSSFQSQGGTDSKRGSMGEADMPVIVNYNRDRRRSSVAKTMRNPDEILEGLRSYKARGELGRTMSLTGDKRRGNRRGERKESVVELLERYDRNSDSDDDERYSQSTRGENGFDIKLGPGQLAPRGFRILSGVQNGEVKLGISMSKGTLEVEVICARNICPGEREEPDTYVKTYLRDGDRWLHKKKTRVIRHSRNPEYRQALKYGSCDALGRNLLVMLWEKKQGFESNQGLGGAEVDLERLPLTRLTIGWYLLFPIHTLGTHSADSP